MLDWLDEMTAAEVSEQAAAYAALAKTGALASTREVFAQLASQCAVLAAKRETEQGQATPAERSRLNNSDLPSSCS
jgi:hypothetical protein